MTARRLLALSIAVLLAGAAVAAPDAGGPAWSQLSASQRNALKPLEREWGVMDAPRKQKWLEMTARFDKMSPDERARVQERMADWAQLSPQQRGQARVNFQGAKQLPTEERQARWQAYQELPEDQRNQLADTARNNARKSGAAPRPAAAAVAKSGAPAKPAGPQPKVNTVPSPLDSARPRPVAPATVQAKPGATTRPISQPATPPLHQQPGMPKIAATPGFVDGNTLLPQRGPQAAAAAEPITKQR